MAEQLALIDLPPQPPEWDELEVFYSLPVYVWPLAMYLRELAEKRAGIRSAFDFGRAIVEPCVGGGAIVDGFARYWHGTDLDMLTGDVRDVGADWRGNWTAETASWSWNRYVCKRLKRAGLVASNPAFSQAIPIIEASWRHCPHAIVAMLLPWRWYEHTEERGPWLRKHNPDLVNIGRCEFFRPDGSSAGKGDSTTYAWAIFGPNRQGPRGGHHTLLPWKEAPNAAIRQGA